MLQKKHQIFSMWSVGKLRESVLWHFAETGLHVIDQQHYGFVLTPEAASRGVL